MKVLLMYQVIPHPATPASKGEEHRERECSHRHAKLILKQLETGLECPHRKWFSANRFRPNYISQCELKQCKSCVKVKTMLATVAAAWME